MKKNANRKSWLVISILLMVFGNLAFAGTIYVKEGNGGSAGLSWLDAFSTLQEALDIVGNADQIWVAAGTYMPSAEVGGSGSGWTATYYWRYS